MSKRIISVTEANKLMSKEEQNRFWKNKYRWGLNIKIGDSKIEGLTGVDWEVTSPFGSVRNAVVLGADGKPAFDRPVYSEADNVNLCVWGMKNSVPVIAILEQERPHAQNPTNAEDTEAPVYGQIVMGFNLSKVFGSELEKYENSEDAATRELGEELGSSSKAIINIESPKIPWLNPSPSFVETSSRLYFVQINPDEINKKEIDVSEGIKNAEMIPVKELQRRIHEGIENGTIYRYGNSLALWMIFFSYYPHLFYKPE